MTGNVWVVLPFACLTGGAFVVYLVARLSAPHPQVERNSLLAAVTALVFAVALGTWTVLCAITAEAWALQETLPQLPAWGYVRAGGAFLRSDPGATVMIGAALGLGMTVAVYSGRYVALDRRYETYYPLLLLLVAGLTGMVLASDLFNLYMYCELMGVTAYALVAFRRRTDTAVEAGFKYLIISSVGTVIILMGISFIYRATGKLAFLPTLNAPAVTVPHPIGREEAGLWTRAGLAFLLVGFAVKSAIVPLHTWLPDAHGRAPSSVSAMLSGVVVQSAFYVLLKVSLGLGLGTQGLGMLLIFLSLLNMTLGNGLALVQTNTKRLLAYSTIAQMGYVMLGVGIGLYYSFPAAIQAGFFLLLAHAAMKGLAFLCKGVCHFYSGATTIAQLRGTARQLPLVAAAFTVALGGLAGIPPLAGFAGRWFVLSRALSSTMTLGRRTEPVYVGLVFLLLNSLLSLGYYLPLIGTLFAPSLSPCKEEGKRGQVRVSLWMAVPLVLLGGVVLSIGFYPGPWLDWTADVGAYLLALGR